MIHLRDFVDAITDDPTRQSAPNYTEIQTDINIFDEDLFYSPNITVEPIRTRIRVYLTREERGLYLPNTFFYCDGRFSTTLSTDNVLEIGIQALSLMGHPGDVADFDEYHRHLPEQWCPMVTIIGSVRSRHPSESRLFTVETSVYDASKAAPIQFSVVCFFENTKRWQNVKTPPPEAFLSVTAKVAARTTGTNLLALRVLDLTYLPRPASAAATSTPTTTPPSKRSGRWDGRATPSTPKRPRFSDPASEAVNSSSDGTTTRLQATQDALGPSHVEDTTEFTSASPSPIADPDESPLPSVLSLTSNGGTRPHRNPHPPRTYTDLE